MKRYTGNCLCAGVRFSILGEIGPIQVCHCMQCRKAQGTALATKLPVHTDDFKLEQGNERLTSFESSPGKQRVFCKQCGSPIYSQLNTLPGIVRIRPGLINEDIDAPLKAHFYAASKANWWPLADDALPRFEAGSDSCEWRG